MSLVSVIAMVVLGVGQCAPAAAPDAAEQAARRERMVHEQIEGRGVRDRRVLDAMRAVPRHAFVPAELQRQAYTDQPLEIGHEQTISQPYIVALMTELAAPTATARVLEIGTGSGYQAAVLSRLAGEVFSIEIVPELASNAAARLRRLGYENVSVRTGDGYRGWPEHAPFDAILLTAAPPEIPGPLLDQLAVGGRLVAPVGEHFQDLVVVTRTRGGYERRSVVPVMFVPMVGEAQERR